MSDRSWAVIGAGPVGGIAAVHLARAGEKVCVVEIKQDLAEAIEANGVTVENLSCADGGSPDTPKSPEDTLTAKPAAIVRSIKALADLKPDTIIIAVKAAALPVIIDDLAGVDTPFRSIIVMQNGIDNEDKVAERFGPERTFRVVVNYAGGMLEPGRIKMTFFHRPNHIGTLDPSRHDEAKEIGDLLTRAFLETAYSENVKHHEWVKTILNAGLSPVCAVSGLRMSEAMSFQPVRFITERILKEGISVAEAAGYVMEPDFFDKAVTYLATAGPHKPSMMIDIEAGLATEVEFIMQKILDYGEKHRISTPYIRAVTGFVRGLEQANRLAKEN
ncbi:ketopantoate reductase family protein [Acidobacteriota bacterium]